jgi:hypothetical protein
MKEKHKIYYNYKLEDIYLRDMLKFFLLGVNLINLIFGWCPVFLTQFFVVITEFLLSIQNIVLIQLF